MSLQVLHVNSPDRVWIQLAEYPEHDLEELSVAMTTSDPNTMSRGELMVGLYCAVLVSVGGTQEREEDGFYRRARVTEVNRPHYIGQPQARLELIDCGSTMHSVSLRNLYKLPHGLRVGVVPPLALPTAIDGLYSTFNHGEEWFPLDKQLLWKHLRHKMVFAKVTRKPSGLQVGVVDIYYDRVGKNRVTNLLLTKGLYLSSTSLLAETTPTPQTTPSQAVTTPPRSLLSRLSYLLKKSKQFMTLKTETICALKRHHQCQLY
ncbi:uncharacterized protein LOC135343630 [Halichondria panicea]|uniref:uncharacterized protein LOC135343630 n=1 Tax=Halichondria panicea TaxID=6063 RepID=UPI00312B78F8